MIHLPQPSRTTLPASRLKPLAGLICIALGGLGANASADQWAIDSGIQPRVEVNDNYLFVANPKETVRVTGVQPWVTASRNTESTEFAIDGRATMLTFHGENVPSRTDYNLSSSYRNSMPTETLQLGLQILRDSTLDSELRATGVALKLGQRLSRSATPEWRHRIDPRLSTVLNAQLSSVTYSSIANTPAYHNNYVGAGLSYDVTERDSLTALLGRTAYRPDTANADSTTNDVRLTLRRSVTSRTSGEVTLGRFQTATQSPLTGSGFETTTRGWLAVVAVNHQLNEYDTIGVRVDRRVQPSGSQNLVLPTSLGLTWNHLFSAQIKSALAYETTRTRYLTYMTTGETTYRSMSASLMWDLKHNKSLEFGLRHARSGSNNSAFGTPNAKATAIFANFNFQFDRLDVSR